MQLVDVVGAYTEELEAAEADGREQRQLPERSWKALINSGVLRCLQPARYGGGEVHLREYVDAVVEISRVSPSAGWVAGVVGVHPWQLALFDERAQHEMWSDDPTQMHSSSYNPTGKAEKVDGGYRVWGRWSFSSGCDRCVAVNLGAIASGEEDRRPDFRSFLLHRDQYRIEDNWHVAGLAGTGSKDIVVEEAFVPDHRSQSHLDYASGAPLAGQEINTSTLYRLPWSVVFNLALAASVAGMAKGFVETWTEETKPRSVAGGLALADDPLTQRRLAEAVFAVDTLIISMRDVVDEMWATAEAGDVPDMAQRGSMRWRINRASELVGDAVVDLFRSASGRTIFLDHPLQARFQDVQGGLGHAFLVPDPLARAVGGALLGTGNPEMVL